MCARGAGGGGDGTGGGGASAAERAARSLALERAYVHDVYERAADASAPAAGADGGARDADGAGAGAARTASRFLAELEPGSLVCDVGCGGGQHLRVNPLVWSLGGDRCERLATAARGRGGEVLVCDNLALPFRDGAFDAVLSAAVVHHFATAERRARALRELARVLRVGGRVLVTVWAMEQRGRRFESQDVLVPWHRPQTLCSPSLELRCNAPASDDDVPYPNAHHASDSDSRDSQKRARCRSEKSHSGDTPRALSYSPGNSSLSSPNETCYSFVRKAIQKLAGSKRASRPWFLDSWSNYSRDSTNKKYDRDDSEENEADIQDLPIELRRIDDDVILNNFTSSETSSEMCISSQKSKSLTDILSVQEKSLVRSRSSVPSFENTPIEVEPVENKEEEVRSDPPVRTKPKLVKQKKSINEEDMEEDLDKPTDMKSLVKELPSFRDSMNRLPRKGVIKQSSLNEELMSRERLREREKLRKNIQKQASLNEEYLYRRHRTLDSLRDSFFSTSANTAKKIQSLKNGLTTKLKKSTTNIEKVTVTGFVRMFQGWKSYDSSWNTTSNVASEVVNDAKSTTSNDDSKTERRHSKEDGSDSSKDSSLQSDTSVDSEDSFASVIYIPKNDGSTQDPLSPTPLSPGPTSPRLKVSSVPTSPRIKSAPGLTSPRLKQMPFAIYPVITRPPGSPKSTQSPCQITKILSLKNTLPLSKDTVLETRSQPNSPPKCMSDVIIPKAETDLIDLSPKTTTPIAETETDAELSNAELIAEINKDIEEIHKLTTETELIQPRVLQDVKPYPKITLQTVAELPEIPQFKGGATSPIDTLDARYAERKKRERLRQIRELLKQRPGFSTSGRSVFPLVRRYSAQDGKAEPTAKPLPKLLSLELFNPETDDMDSDSSGASSPDSVDSVIKVVPDDPDCKDKSLSLPHKDADVLIVDPKSSPSSQSLIEAAAEVAQSLDDTCETIIQSSPRAKRKQLVKMESSEAMAIAQGGSGSSSGSSWSLNKLSPGDLRLLESRSHTSSSGSTSSLERLSPGRRSKERSPRQGSTSNSTWSLNRLSPVKYEARSFEENAAKSHRSPTTSVESAEAALRKSDSFTRLKANEKLVTCKSDIITSAEEEREWNQQCRRHLTEFAEKLSEKLLHEIDQYSKRLDDEDFDINSEKSKADRKKRLEEDKMTQSVLDDLSESLQHLNDPYIHKLSTDIQGLSKLSAEIHEKNKYLATLNENSESDDVSKLFPKCALKVRDRRKSLHRVDNINNNTDHTMPKRAIITQQDEESIANNGNPEITIDPNVYDTKSDVSLETGYSLESEISIDSFCTDKRSSLKVGQSTDSSEVEKMEISPESITSRSSGASTASTAPLKSGFSMESSEACDMSGSGSDWSKRDTRGSMASLGTASLASTSEWSKEKKLIEARSSSEETASMRGPLTRQMASVCEPPLLEKRSLEPSLSDTSQDSLPSENGGGAITYHRYYHVFREGELENLIEKYVENLHIITSFYDQANYCVIAEKVQVWTI